MSRAFLRELKRRKVAQTCALYVLMCWSLLQVVDVLLPALGIEENGIPRYLFAAAVLGFPITVALAWFFQITSKGVIRTPDFAERRVLSNIKPINDRRNKPVSSFFQHEESRPEYDWILSAESGPLAGLSFGVTQSLTLGRALSCDVAVISPHVSRNHALLVVEKGRIFIEDLGSANGTCVNGRPLRTRQALHNADEIRIHDIVFRVTRNNLQAPRPEEAASQTTFIDGVERRARSSGDS